MYKISIIIPVYNVEKYVERALKSIVNQTMDLSDIEVLIIDDNSTDNSIYTIKNFLNQYSNFKLYTTKYNSGSPSEPRNIGLNNANGKYIMFLDPDDEYDVNMCQVMYDKIESTNVDLVKCNHKFIYGNESRCDYLFDKNINEIEINCKKDYIPNRVSVCNVIHSRKFLNENNIKFINLSCSEDMVFSVEEFLHTDKIIFLNNFHGYYYYTNDEISHSMKSNNKNLNDVLNGYIESKTIIENNNMSYLICPLFSERCVSFFLRLLDYDGNKIEFLKKFYDFESSLKHPLVFNYLWLRIINWLILKKLFKITSIFLSILNKFRKSFFISMYRRLLS